MDPSHERAEWVAGALGHQALSAIWMRGKSIRGCRFRRAVEIPSQGPVGMTGRRHQGPERRGSLMSPVLSVGLALGRASDARRASLDQRGGGERSDARIRPSRRNRHGQDRRRRMQRGCRPLG